MTLSQSIEEAKLLNDFLNNAYHAIYTMPKFHESEVQLRAETLRGFILVLQNDLFGMINEWETELNEVKK